jgi:hypothetical protein
MGPLLAGNSNKMMIWHAESCKRICFLSTFLARVLLNTVEAKIVLPQKKLKNILSLTLNTNIKFNN